MTLRNILLITLGLSLISCSKNIKEVFHCGDKSILINEDEEYMGTIYGENKPGPISDEDQSIVFPLRVVSVINPMAPIRIYRPDLDDAVAELNNAFKASKIQFDLKEVEEVRVGANIEDVTKNNYRQYFDFSLEYDRSDRITIYLFDDNQDYCKRDGEILSCRRTHGFSFILNETYLNFVLTKQDLINKKVMAHEMGHFLGLQHTFKDTDGKETVKQTDCSNTGDYLCSTPADPGDAYTVYVDYTNCEMFGLKDRDGNEYKPMINNYMSYYSPCYLKPFAFTTEQLFVMRKAALSPRRVSMIVEGS